MKANATKTNKAQAQKPEAAPMKKHLEGIVVSDKMKDTVVVSVQRYFRHPRYKKFITRNKKFMAHNPGNTKKIGDKVTIEETAPISRHKHFKIVETGSASSAATK